MLLLLQLPLLSTMASLRNIDKIIKPFVVVVVVVIKATSLSLKTLRD